jgi:hypothetical protein
MRRLVEDDVQARLFGGMACRGRLILEELTSRNSDIPATLDQLARTRASGSAARPSHLQGRFTSTRESRASVVPSFTRPLHQPRAGIPADTDEMFIVRHLLSHGASWRTVYLQGIDSPKIIDTFHARSAPTIRATAGLSRGCVSPGVVARSA